MAIFYVRLLFTAFLLSVPLVLPTYGLTDPVDATALRNLYTSLNCPSQLKGWNLNGGDPCEESWTGVSCSGSSVIFIKLHGLGLGGNLGDQLSGLLNLKQLDVSNNKLQGEIPFSLPPNATHINLACNNFSQYIPNSLTSLKYLHHLDLSYNYFTEDLPSSFGSLTNLNRLYLQNNKFTGSVILLANLPLTDLNIQNNNFSGVIPREFQYIHNLWIGENMFRTVASYPPWDFPGDQPIDQNISIPPRTQSSAIASYPSLRVVKNRQKRLGPGGIAFMVGGVTLIVTCAAFIIAVRINRSRSRMQKILETNASSIHSLPISTYIDCSLATPEVNSQSTVSGSPATTAPRHLPSVRHIRIENISRKSFSRSRTPATAKAYTVAEIQSATNNFSEDNLLGEGSLGSVYKAVFPDGQTLAVKSTRMVALSLHEEEQVLDVIFKVARLRHPNIVTLVGYCVGDGHHHIVYEYVKNFSLHDALHCNAYKPLPWICRARIALGIARALDYIHLSCLPPLAHSNLKATNILLDDEFIPRLCDCGLATLRSLTSNSVKLKASEMAISYAGYIAPEHGRPSLDNTKSDVYAFGVLLLELLTGRKPFDSSKSAEEQFLVKWASSHLHDYESLEEMVDPTIKLTFSSKVLSRFADIISICIQPQPEFRPSMSEIVESLIFLIQRTDTAQKNGVDIEASEMSFRTSETRFMESPFGYALT
ncbi:PREDICTED: protein STRUBBELIG-RECEPTOR FAMILY 2 isoform X2 [Nelumbo nucifera]|uniref:Protein STRUBBELIG-RECEPTOR FAMILY 2 isoform X2 n=1 Tax=Nelumbo nucifera TaxID=4432 RepID=A0A1U8A6D4_NELNU|nr:PREDICTED: protein STRUBBELIG-RECEPTOR FAMILY 2 isoform X2 [Nelumbo nucifera]